MLSAPVLFTVLVFTSGGLLNAQADPCGMPQDPDQEVQALHGQTFAIALGSQPGTGYSWSISVPPDPAIVEPVSSTIVPAPLPRPGTTETQCFVFLAVGVGLTSMEFQYSRPFDADTPPAKT